SSTITAIAAPRLSTIMAVELKLCRISTTMRLPALSAAEELSDLGCALADDLLDTPLWWSNSQMRSCSCWSEYAPIGDHHNAIEQRLVVRSMYAREPMCQPADRVWICLKAISRSSCSPSSLVPVRVILFA